MTVTEPLPRVRRVLAEWLLLLGALLAVGGYIGCHAYQGYLFSRPLPLQAFEAFMKRV